MHTALSAEHGTQQYCAAPEYPDPGTLFPKLSLGKYRLGFIVKGRNNLRGNTSSAWRGVLGHKLQKMYCPWQGKHECGKCSVIQGCIYNFLFGKTGSMRAYANPPRPYIIREFKKNPESVTVELTLVGLDDEKTLRVLAAFHEIRQAGWGKSRTFVKLDSIEQLRPGGKWRCIFSPEKAYGLSRTSWLLKDYLDMHETASSPWPVRFVTPLRLKQSGHVLNSVPWDWVFGRFARRLSLLEIPDHLSEPVPLPWQELNSFFEYFGRVISVNYWHDMHRYSSPQRKKIPVGGLKGVALVTPPPEKEPAWCRWWHAASLLHLGGKTTLGHGCIEFNNRTTGDRQWQHHNH